MSKDLALFDDLLASFDTAEYIGGGGQKQVFSATHPEYGKVALKVGVYSSAAQLERISREVGLLRSVDSVYFPKQFFFEPQSQKRYLILEELIDGESLEQHLANYTDPLDSLVLLGHLVKGMSFLWSKRVVHRDLKPANIIVSSSGPRIIDLGIARIQDAESLTMTIAPFGPCTPNYASPEQLTNKKNRIDHRSDQFTLGIVLGQLILGGIHPFDPTAVGYGSSIPENILRGAWHRDGIQSVCGEGVFGMLERMLGSEPYQRFRRYQDLEFAIEETMEGIN